MPAPDDLGTRARLAETLLVSGGLLGLELVLFAGALSSGDEVPIGPDVGIHGQLAEFVARHLLAGELPLWNPHVFSGMPALGNPNAMSLYLTTPLAMMLSLPRAMTVATVLHVFLAGLFVYLWTRHQRLHAAGCFLAATMVCFGAPFFARLHPGHLSALVAMTWVPLTLLAVDHLLERPSLGWIVIGALSVALQALGGHSQYFCYGLLAAGLYALPGLFRAPGRAVALSAMGIAGLALASAQLIPVVAAGLEGSRAERVPYELAAEYAMRPSDALGAIVPGFFGHLAGTAYWGNWNFWEITPFVGVVGLALAASGALYGGHPRRRAATALAAFFFLLALGDTTPVFRILYEFVPPFDRFRASGRALFIFSVFVAMLAAIGFDGLVRERHPGRALPTTLGVLAIALLLAAGWVRHASSVGPVTTFRADVMRVLDLPADAREAEIAKLAGADSERSRAIRLLGVARDAMSREAGAPRFETELAYRKALVEAMSINAWQTLRAAMAPNTRPRRIEDWADPATGKQAGDVAALALLVAAMTTGMTALIVRGARSSRRAAYGLALLGVAELTCIAAAQRQNFSIGILHDAEVDRFLLEHPGDYRIYNELRGNSAMLSGARDIWGYDPLVPARYAELIALLARVPRRGPSDFLNVLPRLHPAHRMLRLKYAFIGSADRLTVYAPPDIPEPMPHVTLLGAYTVAADAQEVLRQVATPGWDPTRTVVLETEPQPRPEPHPNPGSVRIVESSTDALTIEADVVAPAILLVTDAYSTYWRAWALEGSSQSAYRVVPANYVLRAVPLAAGHHRMRMEYAPPYLRLGIWLSLTALFGLALAGGGCVLAAVRDRRAWTTEAHPSAPRTR
jgi:hypothetical protein